MARLLLLLAAEVAAALTAHRLAAAHLAGPGADVTWTGPAPVGPALVLVAHLAAAATAWWLLATTAVEVVRQLRQARGQGRGVGRVGCPAWVTRTVQRGLGAALVLGTAAGPAAAAPVVRPTTPPVDVVVAPPAPLLPDALADSPVGVPLGGDTPSRQEAVVSPPSEVPIRGDALSREGAVVSPPAEVPIRGDVLAAMGDQVSPQVGASSPATGGVHVVAPGENLWVIARADLVRAAGPADPPPSDRQVHARWIHILQANAVPSGDPDLIHPGDRIVLPPTAPDLTAPPAEGLAP